MPRLQIHSEVGRLRSVLMHTPGRELALIPPHLRGYFLTEDILYDPAAREHHLIIQEVIRRCGVAVFQFRDLLHSILDEEDSRRGCLRRLNPLDNGSCWRLFEADTNSLVLYLIEGDGIKGVPSIDPIPNVAFQRDIGMIVGDTAITASMKEPVRGRESALFRAIVDYHPDFTDIRKDISMRHHIEGGDVCVVNSEIVVIGYGHRTEAIAAFILAEKLLERGFKTVLAVQQPNGREHMHLDTVFTLISESECLAYAPFIRGSSRIGLSAPTISVFSRGDNSEVARVKIVEDCNLLECLAELGVKLTPIFCGGGDGDHILADREQWWDGVNAFAVAPGKVLLYDRNVATLAALEKSNYSIHAVSTIEDARSICEDEERVVYTVPSYELCRARGSVHCLTMPLCRDNPFVETK